MKILGLTGGMGMGKSTIATLLRRAGVPVFDADAVVHHLQAPGGAALPPIARLVPEAVKDGQLDRAALRQAVLAHPALLKNWKPSCIRWCVRRVRAFCAALAGRGQRGLCWIFPCSLKRGATGSATRWWWFLPPHGCSAGVWRSGGICPIHRPGG